MSLQKASLAMTTTGSSSKRASSQPPAADPGHGPTWMQRQASSPGAAHQIDSGLTQSTAGEAYPVLYTKGAKEAVTIAHDVSCSGLASQAKARVPSLPRAPRACSHAMDGCGMRRRTVWTSGPIMKPHRCRIGLGRAPRRCSTCPVTQRPSLVDLCRQHRMAA